MSRRLRQRIALLLVALTGLVPVQSAFAALVAQPAPAMPMSRPAAHHSEATEHSGHHMAAMPDCPMHKGAPDDGGSCNGGCDHCGACTATMTTPVRLIAESHAIPRLLEPGPGPHLSPAYPHYRPPRA